MESQNKVSTDLKYAQWNPFFNSLQADIDEIKRLNKLIREDTKLIEPFFSLINTMYNSNVTYSPDLQDKLDSIEKKIYGTKYQFNLKANNVTPNMIAFQFSVIKELEQCYQQLIKNFEMNGLIPKRIFTEHKPKGKALYN